MQYKRNNTSNETPVRRRRNNSVKPASTNGKKVGRPPKYNPDLFPNQAYAACSQWGAMHKELAQLFDTTEGMIHQWVQMHEEFSKCIKKGIYEWGTKEAIKSLRKLVTGFSYEEKTVKEFMLSQGRGKARITLPATETITVTKCVPPNMGAVAFWLKCRMREDWKDYKAIELGNLDDGTLKIRVTVGDGEDSD